MSEKKVFLLNKIAHPPVVSHMEAFRQKVVLEVLDGFL